MRLEFIVPQGKNPQTLIYVGKQYANLNLAPSPANSAKQKVDDQRQKIETDTIDRSHSIRQAHAFKVS